MRSFHHFLFLMIVVTWECIFSLSLTLFSVCVTFSFSDTIVFVIVINDDDFWGSNCCNVTRNFSLASLCLKEFSNLLSISQSSAPSSTSAACSPSVNPGKGEWYFHSAHPSYGLLPWLQAWIENWLGSFAEKLSSERISWGAAPWCKVICTPVIQVCCFKSLLFNISPYVPVQRGPVNSVSTGQCHWHLHHLKVDVIYI